MKWRTEYEIKNGNKLDKSKRSSYSPVNFKLKHGCSLETYLELWIRTAIPGHLYFSKNSKIIVMHLDFKK